MRRFFELSISKMMLILTASGFVVALTFAGPEIRSMYQEQAMLRNDTLKTRLSASIGAMTHELQKERGASAGFISSRGANFAEALPRQRQESDRVIADFLTAASGVEGILPADAPAIDVLRSVRARIASLPNLRNRVDGLDVTVPEAVGTITALNRVAISTLPELGKTISYANAARAVQRHAIFMTAKDYAGLERATGAVALAQAPANEGAVPPATLARFNSLVERQDALFGAYTQIASDEIIAVLSEFDGAQATQTVAQLRSTIRSQDATAITGVNPEVWFEAITQKINLIKSIEDLGAAELVQKADEALALSKQRIRSSILLLASLVLVIGITAILLARRVVAAVNKTADRVTALAEGDIDSEIPSVSQPDLRRVTEALAIFQSTELERREEAQHQQSLELSSADGIKRVVGLVSEGDFSARLRLRDLQGASQILGEGLNEIMTVAEDVVQKQQRRDQDALREQRDVSEAGQKAVHELNSVVSACIAGDFSQRLRTDDKDGVFAELCLGVNRIGEVTEGGLTDVMIVLDAIAEGNLEKRMPDTHEGVFQEIGRKINDTSKHLSDVVGRIAHGAQTVKESTGELSDAANDLAIRTETSAKALETTSAAVQELTESVRSTSTGVKEMGTAAKATETEANAAVEAGKKMVAAIEGIATSSSEISKITSVIDDISFQTNLLALNAGVEAARAGEAGKGFAVVASEVRTLAQRAADAAREINALIEKSENQVRTGVEIVGNSREALDNIQASVSGMTRDVLQIVSASEEQSNGISEISSAVSEMEQSTQQNAAMFEETSAVVHAMREETDALAHAVSHFQTSNQHNGSSAHSYEQDHVTREAS